jgi:hypothetical protein
MEEFLEKAEIPDAELMVCRQTGYICTRGLRRVITSRLQSLGLQNCS